MACTQSSSTGRQRLTADRGHHTLREIMLGRRLWQDLNESPKGAINVSVILINGSAVQYLQRLFDFFVKLAPFFRHGVVLKPRRRKESARSFRARCSELLMVP